MRYWVALRVAFRVGVALYKLATANRKEIEWVVKAGRERFAALVESIKKEVSNDGE